VNELPDDVLRALVHATPDPLVELELIERINDLPGAAVTVARSRKGLLMMDELVAWFRGVLDEEEQDARQQVDQGPWGWIIASVAAQRAVLDLVEKRLSEHGEWFDPSDSPIGALHQDDLWTVVEHLAAAYADYPGYREEWRP
jgi:hypothetical protein